MNSCMDCEYCKYDYNKGEHICTNGESQYETQIIAVPVYECEDFERRE